MKKNKFLAPPLHVRTTKTNLDRRSHFFFFFFFFFFEEMKKSLLLFLKK